MFYPSKKQSCMGQAHAARRTAAKLKSVLLCQQLTQINNSQTEDLLGPVLFFFFLAPATSAQRSTKPSFSPKGKRVHLRCWDAAKSKGPFGQIRLVGRSFLESPVHLRRSGFSAY